MGNVLPWGMVKQRQHNLNIYHDERAKGFDQVRARLEAASTAPDRRAGIRALSFIELRKALSEEQVSAVEALDAYVESALQAQDRINCCIEFIVEAWEEARQLDERWKGKRDKPPLFGVPFSVKGNFFLKGYKCTIGLAKYLDETRTEECSMVTHFRNLGAVPFVRTNVPQALLSFVCSNSVDGTTGNPHDPTRTPGGSSGGEAALLVAGGTPFGTGSDLAGSLRIPASMSGCVSLKPTEARLVVLATHGGVPGRTRLALAFGFFTRTVDDQIELLKLIVGDEAYCNLVPTSVRLPLDEAKILNEKRKLRIGYLETDGFLDPTPAQRRAVSETVRILSQQGHELVPFAVPRPDHAAATFYRNISTGTTYSKQLFEADVVDPYLKKFAMLLKLPNWIRGLTLPITRLISPQFGLMSGSYVDTAEDVRQTNEDTDNYRVEWNRLWNEQNLDALVCPSFVVPSVPHEYPSDLLACAFATALYNLLDVPSGIVPVGTVTQEDDDALSREADYPVGHNIVLKYVRASAAKSKGLPIAVQIVAKPFDEETCLRVMREVEQNTNYDNKPVTGGGAPKKL